MSFLRFIPLLLALSFLSACSRTDPKRYLAEGTPAPGDTMVDASIGDARHLTPPLVDEVGGFDIDCLVFNGLLRYDKDLQLRPCLAEKWSVSKNGKIVTYFLRKGVKFHDGVEFTAADVLFTYQVYSSPLVNAPEGANYKDISRVDILDPYKVQVTYKKVFAPALGMTFNFILPKHLLDGKDVNNDPFDRHPVGTGPYRFVEWKTDQQIVLEANPDYWEGKPYVQKYIHRVIPDESTSFLELLKGGVDSLGEWSHGGLTPEQYSRQAKTPKFADYYNAYSADELAYTYIGWNEKNPLFASRKVRQALTMAIDRQAILDNVLYGLGSICTGPFAVHSWAENPKVQPWPFDPARAKALLAEEKWKMGSDGLLHKTIGGKDKVFQFTLLTNQGNGTRQKTATIVQQQLKTVGIRMDIKILEWTTLISQYVNKKAFDAYLMGWTLDPDPDCYQLFHSSQAKQEYQFNYVSYIDHKADALLTAGRGTLDMKKRQAIYWKLHTLLHEDQPYTFLFTPKVLSAVHKRFKGPAPSSLWDPRWVDAWKWYVPAAQQK